MTVKPPTGLLSTRGLSLRFGGVVAADAIDFDLMPGERLAVVGQNGAGKTTFINICTGFLKADSGQVFFDGTEVTGRNPRQITRLGVGRSFQLPQLFTRAHGARLPDDRGLGGAQPRRASGCRSRARSIATRSTRRSNCCSCGRARTTSPARSPKASASCSTWRWRWCCIRS